MSGLRKEIPSLRRLSKDSMEVTVDQKRQCLCVRRWNGTSQVFAAFNFNPADTEVAIPRCEGTWVRRLDSTEPRWRSSGKARDKAPHGTGDGAVSL